jgi:DNA replication protein DnaC
MVRSAKTTPLLVIDDLGTESGDVGTVVEVVLSRYDDDLPTWVTTWLSKDLIASRYGDGFARRLLQEVDIIECDPARGVR